MSGPPLLPPPPTRSGGDNREALFSTAHLLNGIPEWVVDSGVEASFRSLPYAIAIIQVSTPDSSARSTDTKVGLYANPTDIRCYRMIARILTENKQEMLDDHGKHALNQMQTLQDALAVSTAVAVVQQVFWKHAGLFVQVLHLGNNSMRVLRASDATTSDVGLGNIHEPYFYHQHLLCRGGEPHKCYLSGPSTPALGGPPLGMAFPVQGERQPPTPQDLEGVVIGLRQFLQKSQEDDSWKQANCTLEVMEHQ